MNSRVVLACVMLCAVLSGCRTDRRAWTSEDDWYDPLPSGTSLAGWEHLDRDEVHEVVEGKLATAEALLQNVASVEVTAEQASDLSGQTLPDVPGTKPYLVRGLLLNRATGSFSVHVMGDQVSVHHGSLGRSARPMTRQPLVLQLDQPPTHVYVSLSMAE